MVVITSAVDYFIPDIPRKLREHVRREAYLTNEIIIKTELEIARGHRSELTDDQMRDIRQRVRGPLMSLFSKANGSKRGADVESPPPQEGTEEESRV